MNESDTKTMVQAAGRELPSHTRNDVRSAIVGALAGEAPPQLAAVREVPGRPVARHRMAVIVGAAAAVVAVVVTLVVVSGSDHRVLTPATVDPPPPSATPTTLPVTVTDPTATLSSVDTTSPPTAPPSTVTAPVSTDGLISPDSPKVLLDVTATMPVSSLGATRTTIARLQPDGRIFVLDVADRTASITTPTSATITGLAIDLPDVTGFDLTNGSLGPDDVAYLSYRPGGTADGPFVLAAVPLNGPKAGTIVAQWDTDWPCVETVCGEVRLQDNGIVVQGTFSSTNGGSPDTATPPVVAGYVNAVGSPFTGTFDAPDQPGIEFGGHALVLPDDYVNADEQPFGAVSTKVTVADRSWIVDVAGVHIVEGVYTTFQPQSDGTVLARFDVSKDASKPGQNVLLDLQFDGSQVVYQLPDDLLVVDAASVGGQLLAIAVIDDRYQSVILTQPDASIPAPTAPQPIALPLQATVGPESVQWLTATEGWAKPFTESHGSTVPLLHTVDGGRTWTSIDSGIPMTDDTATVRFADAQNGFVLTGGQLYSTHTGGAPWTKVDLGGTWSDTVDIEVDSGYVHVMADSSASGGITLFVSPVTTDDFVKSPVDIPYGAGPVMQTQIVLDGDRGYATYSDRGLIGAARLVDGQWSPWQTPCEGQDVSPVSAAGERVVLGCTTNGFVGPPWERTMYLSNDGGATFAPMTHVVGASAQEEGAVFVWQPADGSIVIGQSVVDGPATIQRSVDGGLSWTTVHEFGPDDIVIGSFDIAGIGFGVMTNAPGGVASYDGGATWQPIESGTVTPS